ncbi:MAG: O-acetylhomoserine aminocarboxypropyltransferase/cysteine synthase family protein [Burkholderiales bacterium]|nr:O-acetylhomoserine aminocarboxypropyltransferase/cysteine synthase family protein [Burkholderiales bacterium]
MADRKFGFETLALHAGQIPDAVTGARAAPIYQTTSFVFDSADHAASLFNLQTFGNVYSRISNPTVAVLEERIAALEGGRAALACASGQAAEATAILTLAHEGDHIVSASTLYGGTHTLLAVNLAKLGIETTFVHPDDPENFRRALRPNTKLLYCETLGNPLLNVVDLEAVAQIAHEAGVPLVVDNTVASPYLCRPIEWGADIVVHSATKYLGGHGTTMGGVIVESGRFDWGNGKFPEFTSPSPGYHGVIFHETFGDFGFTMKARMEVMRTFGPALSPIAAWLILQGVETLPVRMERHCANALAVAKFLADHPRVAWVNYPGLEGDRYHRLARKYLPRGASGLVNFGIRGGARAGERFIEAAQMMSHLANIGDAKTLVIHPASTTHRQMSEEEQRKAGVTPDMIRLSVGLETLEDILWDVDQALAASARA